MGLHIPEADHKFRRVAPGKEIGKMAENFDVEKKSVTLYGSKNAGSPLVLLNTYGGNGSDVQTECDALCCPPFTLAVVSRLDWNADMSPWECEPLSKSDSPCTGKADSYLALVTGKILPAVCERLSAAPAYTAIAGYSLAGLFALYAAYRTDAFSRIASASGSLWFPRFSDFAQKEPFVRTPERIYLSLGDREAKTRNKILCSVEEKTEELASFYHSQGIPTIFEMNRGNHFTDGALRMARGIKKILS
ncbi:MAG: hypothetical protein IJ727_10900 [Treponema sp.]|nr:hypothetical protein [Treponema sp.]